MSDEYSDDVANAIADVAAAINKVALAIGDLAKAVREPQGDSR